jgi:hypothetical protein
VDERVTVNGTATCRSCGAEIVWGMTAHGTAIPLNPRLLTVIDEAGRVVRGRESHFATCPHAPTHRKREARR